jgi:hypothetical protein
MSSVSFLVSKDMVRSIKVPTADGKLVTEHTIKVPATNIELSEIKDNNNPRSHQDDQLSGRVVNDIIHTLEEQPANFVTYNKGAVVVGSECVVEDKGSMVEVTIKMPQDENKKDKRALHGACDGATSMAIVKRWQKSSKVFAFEQDPEFRKACIKQYPKLATVILDASKDDYEQASDEDQILIGELVNIKDVPKWITDYTNLNQLLIPITVYSGNVSEEFITGLCEARNTNKPVSKSSMADFKKDFDIIKNTLRHESYGDNIAYEENSPNDIKVERIIQIMNGFRRPYVGRATSIVAGNPTQSYSSKGSLIGLFSTNNDNNARDQFEELTDIMPDLLKLFDIIRRDMPTVYNGNGGKSGALGKAKKGADIAEKNLPFITSQTEENLFFLGETCKRHTNLGVLFPVLFAFRALVGFDPTANKAVWETDPFEFWNTNKSVLVDCVMTKLKDELNLDPQMCGKSAGTYQQLRDRARLLFLDAVREAI